jgi:hypothetical protein
MAKDKKSFLLYCDLIHTIEKLPDEKAGQLFKIILQYVNDKNPIIEDLLLQVSFEPIKQSLKRDLAKYTQFVEKQSFNGSKGGRPKKAKQTQKTQAFFEKPKKADNVSDSVIDIITIPSFNEFLDYAKTLPIYKPELDYAIQSKYETWKEQEWKVIFLEGKKEVIRDIKNWKSTLRNTLPHLKPIIKEVKLNWKGEPCE